MGARWAPGDHAARYARGRVSPIYAVLMRKPGRPIGMMVGMDDLEAVARMGTARLRSLVTRPRHGCRGCGVELEDRPGRGRPRSGARPTAPPSAAGPSGGSALAAASRSTTGAARPPCEAAVPPAPPAGAAGRSPGSQEPGLMKRPAPYGTGLGPMGLAGAASGPLRLTVTLAFLSAFLSAAGAIPSE